MTLGILLSFAAMISWSLSDIVTKISLERASKWRVLFIGQLSGALVILLMAVAFGEAQITFSTVAWYLVILAGLNFFAFYGYYKAVKVKGISLITPIINAWPLVAIALGVIFYGEVLAFHQIISAVLVLGGMFITTVEKMDVRVDPAFMFAIGAMLLWGLFFFLLKIPTLVFGAFMTTLLIKMFTLSFTVPIMIKKKIQVMHSFRHHVVLFMILVGVLDGLGFLAFNSALQYSAVSIVSPIIAAVPVLTIAFGYVLLRERLSQRQGIGIIMTLIGLFLMV